MNQVSRTIIILVTASIYAGFAIWLGLWPQALLQTFGIDLSTAAMLTEIRAFYGGVELGIALAMLVLWHQGNSSAALLIGGLPLAGSASGRLLGMMADGFASTHLTLAMFELLGCAACMSAYYYKK